MENEVLVRKLKRQIKTQVKRLQSGKTLKADDIHNLRVLTKKLRAYLRLYPGDQHKGLQKRMDRSIKDISRDLSGLRDKYVLNEKLNNLSQELFISPVEPFELDQSVSTKKQRIKRKRVIFKLEKIGTKWERLAKNNSNMNLFKGLRKSYKKNQSLGITAVESNEDQLLHQWRKWVKYWLYQSEVLSPKRGKQNRKYLSRLRELGSLLGVYHDYCNLELAIQGKRLTSKNHEIESALSELITDKKCALRRIFVKEYQYLFGRKFSQLDIAGKRD